MKHSESIGEITRALVKAQSEMKAAKMTATNPFYKRKYATLSDVWDVIRPVLEPNGLAIIQTLGSSEIGVSVTTMLLHTSGQYFEDTIDMAPEKNTPQGYGIAITYARRYSISAFMGVVNEEDTDGNSAGSPPKPMAKSPVKTKKKEPVMTPSVALRELHEKCLTGINILYKKDSDEWKTETAYLESCKDSLSKMAKLHGLLVAQYKVMQKKDTEVAGAEGFDGKVKDAFKGEELQPGDMS